VQASSSNCLFLRPDVLIIDGLFLGQHALMQNTRNQNAFTFPAVEHNMPAAFHATQTRANVVIRTPQRRVVGEHLTTCLKLVDVSIGLCFAPSAESIVNDAQQVGFGTTRETNESHRLA